jgi:hypothetical protein
MLSTTQTFGPQAPVVTECGTILGVSAGGTVGTLSFTPALPTPANGVTNFAVSAAGTNYSAGDIITLAITGASPIISAGQTLVAQQRVQSITAESASIANRGSSGPTSTTCGVVGTSGTINANPGPGEPTGYYEALVQTSSTGSISNVVSITNGGNYIVTPSSSDPMQADSNSATPCTGLTGAALTPSFGVLAVTPHRYGYYTSTIGTGVSASQASATGSGTGISLTTTGNSIPVSGVVTWGSDASSSYATAVAQVNAGRANGINTLLYVPPGQCASGGGTVCTLVSTGAYFFGNSVNPALTTGAGIVTDGDGAVTFYMSPQYCNNLISSAGTLCPLVWWDSPGKEQSTPFDGATAAFSEQFGPSLTGGLTIVGDRTSAQTQVGMAFCGSNYFAEIHNYQFRNLPGTGLQYGCLANSETISHNRESRFYNIRGFNSGASPGSNAGSINYAAIDINTQAPAGVISDMDDVEFDNVELFGNHGKGIILHAARGGTQPGSIGFVTFAGRLRVEGLAPDGTPLSGPLIQIGDTATNFDGEINNVSFPAGMQLVDPYLGSAAILVTSSGTAVNTYPNTVTTGPGTVINGGAPWGNGLDIEYCTNCNFNIQSILTSGINYTQGNSTTNLTLQLPAGATSGWSSNLGTAAVINYAALGLSTGSLGGSIPFVMPIPLPQSGPPITPSTNATSTSWSTSVNSETGTYFEIGPLTCVDILAQLNVTVVGTASGALNFFLPVKPSITSHDAIAVSQVNNGAAYSAGMIWPPTSTGTVTPTPTSQIFFVPTPNRFYGQIQFEGSKYNTPAIATTLNFPSASPPPQGIQLGTLYSFAINGCYQ